MNFEYVRKTYGVPSELNRKVLFDGKKATIVKDFGHYIGVHLDGAFQTEVLRCHPIWQMVYLDEVSPPLFNKISKKKEMAKQRYNDYCSEDSGESFFDWIKRKELLRKKHGKTY